MLYYGQGILISQCFSTPSSINGYLGVVLFLFALRHRKWDKLLLFFGGPLQSGEALHIDGVPFKDVRGNVQLHQNTNGDDYLEYSERQTKTRTEEKPLDVFYFWKRKRTRCYLQIVLSVFVHFFRPKIQGLSRRKGRKDSDAQSGTIVDCLLVA